MLSMLSMQKKIMKFHCIVALDEKLGIGFQGKLPWKLRADMRWFKQTTLGNSTHANVASSSLIMGRKTWLSLSPNYRPLKNRMNIILSRQAQTPSFLTEKEQQSPFVKLAGSLDEALTLSQALEGLPIFVIGGAQIFKLFLSAAHIENLGSLYVTHVKKTFPSDALFPNILQNFQKQRVLDSGEENSLAYEIIEYTGYLSPS